MRPIACAAAALVWIANPALALDQSDVGDYALVHVDGHVTDMIFRVSHPPDKWKVENRQPDGSWQDVSCEAGCLLVDSSGADVERFLGEIPNGRAATCIHNSSFAICRVTDQARPAERQYVFVALTQQHPITLRLARQEK